MNGLIDSNARRLPLYFIAFMATGAPPQRVAADELQLLELSGDLGVHDPCAIKSGDIYYLFATGGRRGRGIVPIHTSTDMRSWSRAGFAMERLPEWVADDVPRAGMPGRPTSPTSTASTTSTTRCRPSE